MPTRHRIGRFLGYGACVGLAACSASVHIGSTPQIDQSELEKQVATQLAAKANQPVPTVNCPSGVDATVGATIDCTLTAQGATIAYPVHVTVTAVNGTNATFDAEVGQTPVGSDTSTTQPGDTSTTQAGDPATTDGSQ